MVNFRGDDTAPPPHIPPSPEKLRLYFLFTPGTSAYVLWLSVSYIGGTSYFVHSRLHDMQWCYMLVRDI